MSFSGTGRTILFTVWAITCLFAVSNVSASCTAAQTPPTGIPLGFDTNAELAKIEAFGAVIDSINLPELNIGGANMHSTLVARVTARMHYMVIHFAPGAEFDLKNRAVNPSSQEFGNFFYGAAISAIGLSEEMGLRAAAIVQQYQDYHNSNHPNAGNFEQAILEAVLAAISTPPGVGDNPDDPPTISNGFDYEENVYSNDPNAGNVSDSCSQNSTQQPDSSNGGRSIAYWTPGGAYIGSGACIGQCAVGIVTIEDILPAIDPN